MLAQADAMRIESPSRGRRVFVRLLATPERIKRELVGELDALELELLRALWRAAGKRSTTARSSISTGCRRASAAPGAMPHARRRSQSRQFLEWQRLGGGIRLVDPRTPLAAFPIDWAALDRRRSAELAKLDAMQQYAYHHRLPPRLRAALLRRRGRGHGDCGGCDNCLGVTHDATGRRAARRDATREAERAASARRRATRTPAAEPMAELVSSPSDAAALRALRALRTRDRAEEQVPAYVVFPDRTLAEFARAPSADARTRSSDDSRRRPGEARQVRRAIPRSVVRDDRRSETGSAA